MANYNVLKKRLRESFHDSKERGLSDDQVRWAKDCAVLGQELALSDKFQRLPFAALLQQNNNNYVKLNNALGLILQYITDLLSPELPPNWWSISTRNTSYAYRVKNVVGVEDIFKLAGYTKKSSHFLAFPEGNRTKPDRELLADLATEILLAREECSAAADGRIGSLSASSQMGAPFHPHSRSTGPRTEILGVHPQYENIALRTHVATSIINPTSTNESMGFQVPSTVSSPGDTIDRHPLSSTTNNRSGEFENKFDQGQVGVTTSPQGPPPVPKPRTRVQQRTNSTSSGSSSSSPSNSMKFSGPITETPERTPSDESKDFPSGDDKMPSAKKRRAALMERIKKFNETRNQDPYPDPDPAAPLQDKTPSSYSSPKETIVNDPSESTPFPRIKSKTTTDPAKPLTFNRLSSGERIGMVEEIVEEQDQPTTPKKCPNCQNHLSDSSVCPYCSSLPSPLETPTPKPRPVPKPRTRRPKTEVQAPREPSPMQVSRISGGLNPPTHSTSQQNPLGLELPPLAEPKETPEPLRQSEELEEAVPYQPKANPVESEALKNLYEKYKREAEYFKSLSLKEQDEHIDQQIEGRRSVDHLRRFYKGMDWYGRNERKELECFERLGPDSQKRLLEEKRSKGEKISHLLVRYIGPKIGRKAIEVEDEHLQRKQQEKEKAKNDGKYFCECIKRCSQYGFSPREVEIALQHRESYQDPLNYLQIEWKKCIDDACSFVCYNRMKVGSPSKEEIRNHLIEAKGNFRVAGKKCVANRVNKIRELEKLAKNIEHDRPLLIDCLDTCELVVEEAFYELQRRGLMKSGLYRYLTGERGSTEETKTEMDLMKEKVLERIKDKEQNKESYMACIRMLMAENKFREKEKAVTLIKLLEDNSDYPMKYYIDATKHYENFEDALKFLNQPCPICTDTFIMDDMVVMPACGDALCKHCFSAHFSLSIKEKSVKHFNCPLCGEPDLSNPDETQDMNLELFVALVKEFLEKEDYDLCQQKLTDFNLSKQSNFVWCINEKCRSGFLTDRVDRIRVECPHCHHDMCFLCKKKWEHQHEGLTCDQFTQWKIDNDPEAQKQGLAAHLKEHGIQCPGCKFRYDLARGGCMHFRCTQCPVEFCSGCYGIIKKGEDCGKFEACKRLGLHAHHPRDCLFYLRDFTVADLQTLLTANNVEFDQDPPQAQVDAAREKKEGEDGDDEQVAAPIVEDIEEEQDRGDDVQPAPGPVALKCCVMLQKEGPEGLYDEECGAISPDKMAGLCETHYKEYLVSKINKHKLDPSELYPIHQLKRILEREEKEVPEKNLEDDESDEDYKQRLIELIGNELPIQQKEDAIKPDM